MNIRDLLGSFEEKHILVVGDTVVDVNTYCKPLGISAETPTMVLQTLHDERGKCTHPSVGGAGLVARNLLELGAHVDFLTVTGYGEGARYAETISSARFRQKSIKIGIPQVTKRRFWCGNYKMLQVDTVEKDYQIDSQDADRVLARLQSFVEGAKSGRMYDAVIIADYRHGMLNEKIVTYIFSAFDGKVPLYAASQVSQSSSNHHWYESGNAFLVMNENEYKIANVNRLSPKVVTCGESGSFMFRNLPDEQAIRVTSPAIKIDSVDTCGAGDAFIAAFVLHGGKNEEAMRFANIWAGLSCAVLGPNPPLKETLLEWSHENRV